MKDEKSCENCRYFLQHYVKSNARYYRTYCGHCVNTELSKKEKRERDGRRIHRACELWEPMEMQKAERIVYIKDVLRSMAKSLEEMTMMLKDDREG